MWVDIFNYKIVTMAARANTSTHLYLDAKDLLSMIYLFCTQFGLLEPVSFQAAKLGMDFS